MEAPPQFLKSLSITEHYEDFLKGVIDTGAVVYYLAFISFGSSLTSRALTRRGGGEAMEVRWRA